MLNQQTARTLHTWLAATTDPVLENLPVSLCLHLGLPKLDISPESRHLLGHLHTIPVLREEGVVPLIRFKSVLERERGGPPWDVVVLGFVLVDMETSIQTSGKGMEIFKSLVWEWRYSNLWYGNGDIQSLVREWRYSTSGMGMEIFNLWYRNGDIQSLVREWRYSTSGMGMEIFKSLV